MDTIGGLNVMSYTNRQVLEYIKKHSNWHQDKKVMELVCGYLLSMCLKNTYDRDYNIGFPMTEIRRNPEPGLSLEELLGDLSQIQDDDFDICLCWSKGEERDLIFCQVTRLVALNKIVNPWERLKNLLDKKRLVQHDPKINLIINIEDDISINPIQLQEYFTNEEYPYGLVAIVGKKSAQSRYFKIIQAWPTPLEIYEFDTKLPV